MSTYECDICPAAATSFGSRGDVHYQLCWRHANNGGKPTDGDIIAGLRRKEAETVAAFQRVIRCRTIAEARIAAREILERLPTDSEEKA